MRFDGTPSSIARRVRDGWAVFGIALALAIIADLGVNAALRLYDWQRLATERRALAVHPYAAEPWFAVWRKQGWPEGLPRSYDAYRAWRMSPINVDGFHLDSRGVRLTVADPPRGTPRRILMLGGSVMWGYTVRDSETIPSLVARKLQARGLVDVDVANAAQPGYVTSQDVATLFLELRDGRLPSAVVFLNGVNDVAAASEWGEAGHVYFERTLAARMRSSGGSLRGIVNAISQASSIAEVFGPRLARLRRAARPVSSSVCQDVAAQYWNQVQTVNALARQYGFATLFAWQPALATTHKPLTLWERSVRSDHPLVQLLGPCTEVIEAAADQHPDFLSLRTLFDDQRDDVFLDQWGYITERANASVASVLADRLARELGS